MKMTIKKKKYGLTKKQQSLTASIFGEDEDNDVEKEISRQASKTKENEEQHKKSLEEDPSAFAYDELYDDMKQKSVLHGREVLKPRYIPDLMKQADRRQKEREIVHENTLAKERAKDQHLFPDELKFVSGVYKRKLEERDQWLSEERVRELVEEKDDVTKKKDLTDFYFNIGKNVAFGAPDIKARKAEESREEKKTYSPEKVPGSRDLGSSCRKPQGKKTGSEVRGSSIKGVAKDRATYQHRTSKDAIAAAKQRLFARKKIRFATFGELLF